MRHRYIKFSRKRNIRKIPNWVLTKARHFTDDELVAACVKRVSATEVASGSCADLNIQFESGQLQFPETQLPNVNAGKYSHRNSFGCTLVRKDLPKVTKTFTMEVPNFGDWSKGSHTVHQDRQVYRRNQIAPKRLKIQTELLGQENANDGSFVFGFRISEVVNKEGQNFHADLLEKLNLLQENVGSVDIFPADTTTAGYLNAVQVNWEILPPGEREQNIAKMLSGKEHSSEARGCFEERYDLLAELDPVALVNGTGGFSRYFGAKFADDLVVLENMEYGNAIYVMFEEWESLSQKSRTDLLNGGSDGFVRILHTPNWELRLRNEVENRR